MNDGGGSACGDGGELRIDKSETSLRVLAETVRAHRRPDLRRHGERGRGGGRRGECLLSHRGTSGRVPVGAHVTAECVAIGEATAAEPASWSIHDLKDRIFGSL